MVQPGLAAAEGDLAVKGGTILGVAAGRDAAERAARETDHADGQIVCVVIRYFLDQAAHPHGADADRFAVDGADQVELVDGLLDNLAADNSCRATRRIWDADAGFLDQGDSC